MFTVVESPNEAKAAVTFVSRLKSKRCNWQRKQSCLEQRVWQFRRKLYILTQILCSVSLMKRWLGSCVRAIDRRRNARSTLWKSMWWLSQTEEKGGFNIEQTSRITPQLLNSLNTQVRRENSLLFAMHSSRHSMHWFRSTTIQIPIATSICNVQNEEDQLTEQRPFNNAAIQNIPNRSGPDRVIPSTAAKQQNNNPDKPIHSSDQINNKLEIQPRLGIRLFHVRNPATDEWEWSIRHGSQCAHLLAF